MIALFAPSYSAQPPRRAQHLKHPPIYQAYPADKAILRRKRRRQLASLPEKKFQHSFEVERVAQREHREKVEEVIEEYREMGQSRKRKVVEVLFKLIRAIHPCPRHHLGAVTVILNASEKVDAEEEEEGIETHMEEDEVDIDIFENDHHADADMPDVDLDMEVDEYNCSADVNMSESAPASTSVPALTCLFPPGLSANMPPNAPGADMADIETIAAGPAFVDGYVPLDIWIALYMPSSPRPTAENPGYLIDSAYDTPAPPAIVLFPTTATEQQEQLQSQLQPQSQSSASTEDWSTYYCPGIPVLATGTPGYSVDSTIDFELSDSTLIFEESSLVEGPDDVRSQKDVSDGEKGEQPVLLIIAPKPMLAASQAGPSLLWSLSFV